MGNPASGDVTTWLPPVRDREIVDLASALRERLNSDLPGLRVWQDRPEIEGGGGLVAPDRDRPGSGGVPGERDDAGGAGVGGFGKTTLAAGLCGDEPLELGEVVVLQQIVQGIPEHPIPMPVVSEQPPDHSPGSALTDQATDGSGVEGRRFEAPELRRRQDLDAGNLAKGRQILVTCDNSSAGPGQGRGQNPVVIAIAAKWWRQGQGIHHLRRTPQQRDHRLDGRRADPELARQPGPKFPQDEVGKNDPMVPLTMFQQVVAGPTGEERGQQHVGVEHQPHDTRRNTSSSVKTPWASA